MKKTLLAITLAASMVSGCSMIGGADTVSYAELQKEGTVLFEQSNESAYKPSNIQEVEAIRLIINSAFLSSKPVYERYTEELLKTPELGNYFAAVEAVDSEEEKRAIYDSLALEQKKIVDDFNKSSIGKEIAVGLKDASLVVLKNADVFLNLDTTTILANVDFSNLMSEKDALTLTTEQVLYLNKTVVSAYKNHKIVSAFSNSK